MTKPNEPSDNTSPSHPSAWKLSALLCLLALAWGLSVAAEEAEKKRVVIRTTADGKVEVVGAEEATAGEETSAEGKETKDRQALEAMAQRLWTADSAEQSLSEAGQPSERPRAKQGAASSSTSPFGSRRLTLKPRTEGSRTTDSSARPAPTLAAGQGASGADITPCLATGDEESTVDPCEVARRIGRLEPCRNPEECAAYEAWRRQYGAPGLRAAQPKASAPPAAEDDPERPRR